MPLHLDKQRPKLTSPSVLVATWFGAGYLPKAPGTWGSLAALPCSWLIMQQFGAWGLMGAAGGLFLVGIWAANGYMAQSGTHDPGPVVVDEVVGQWLVLSILPLEIGWYLIGFALFRLFDILKPWPITWLDRQVEGGFGVMIDDVGAAAYGVAVVLGLQYVMEHVL